MSKFRFTIGRRIGLGFGLLILLTIVIFILIFLNVTASNDANEESNRLKKKIEEVYTPSLQTLNEIKTQVLESKKLITIWVKSESRDDDKDKVRLRYLVDEEIPKELEFIRELRSSWDNETEKEISIMLEAQLDSLFEMYMVVRTNLAQMEDYSDFIRYAEADNVIASGGKMDVISKKIQDNLSDLIRRHESSERKATAKRNEATARTDESLKQLLKQVAILAFVFVGSCIVVGVYTTSSIVKPVNKLKGMLNKMGRGVIPDNRLKPSNDEVGEMAAALNRMIDGFERTTEFSHQVGSGNFDYDYQPLSDEDTLGHALLKMRDDLAENERILEQKVVERTEEVVRQRDEIERQRLKVEELYKDVTDSIRYAKRLQDSILPPESLIKELVPESFVLFKPKDIVSGDFYWFGQCKGKTLFAAVDCTGHGVPGAFMSLVGANALNQAVREHQLAEPAKILDDLNRNASATLNKTTEDNSVRDGMDLAMCALDRDNLELEYAGANNPLYLVRDGKIEITKADKFAIGSMTDQFYTNHKIKLKEGDKIYIFSDGYADQFGGPKGKKFMYSKFRKLILSISDKPMAEQGQIFSEEIEKWKGQYEQIDDILLMGVRV